MSNNQIDKVVPCIMDSHNYKCIVYLESYFKTGEMAYDAYIDFRKESDLEMFQQVANIKDTKGTYIELRNMKSSKRLRRGCYYALNLELLKNSAFEQRDDSYIIGGSYNLDNMKIPEGNDGELLQTHEPLEPTELSEESVPNVEPTIDNVFDDLELYVKDVDQANWNELRSKGNVVVLYDAGAELRASMAEIDSIFKSRSQDLAKSRPVLIISHWDMDHIHCLKKLSIDDIQQCFSKIICPDRLKSCTSRRILANFITALGVSNVYCLPVPRRSGKNVVHLWKTVDPISIYRCESSSNINYCGLLMFVRGNNKSANYTGDCRLIQADNVYNEEKQSGLQTEEHILIAPHHGGPNDPNYRVYGQPCTQVVISVGQNNGYGHPDGTMEKYLNHISSAPIWRTDTKGDFTVDL